MGEIRNGQDRLENAALRTLQWKNRQLRKQCGKQGETIYRLRARVAELEALTTKAERGDLRTLRERNDELCGELADSRVEIHLLKEKLQALEQGGAVS